MTKNELDEKVYDEIEEEKNKSSSSTYVSVW